MLLYNKKFKKNINNLIFFKLLFYHLFQNKVKKLKDINIIFI